MIYADGISTRGAPREGAKAFWGLLAFAHKKSQKLNYELRQLNEWHPHTINSNFTNWPSETMIYADGIRTHGLHAKTLRREDLLGIRILLKQLKFLKLLRANTCGFFT